MPIIDADHEELRNALLKLRSAYSQLAEPRRWYSALVCSVLVKSGQLPEWTDWQAPPPAGASIQITPAVDGVIDSLFGTKPDAVLRPDAITALGNPLRIIVDPLRQPGRSTPETSLCVVVSGYRWDIPVSDPGWLWNQPSPLTGYENGTAQIKHSNDYGAQQGILCYLPAQRLFALSPSAASRELATGRPNCQQWGLRILPSRPKSGSVTPPPQKPTPSCGITMKQCASKGAGVKGPGGPRALIPDADNSNSRLLAPGSFERILKDANPNGVPLPSRNAMALAIDYLSKGHGQALNTNRLVKLIAPHHLDILFST